jgi:hypothetical protein
MKKLLTIITLLIVATGCDNTNSNTEQRDSADPMAFKSAIQGFVSANDTLTYHLVVDTVFYHEYDSEIMEDPENTIVSVKQYSINARMGVLAMTPDSAYIDPLGIADTCRIVLNYFDLNDDVQLEVWKDLEGPITLQNYTFLPSEEFAPDVSAGTKHIKNRPYAVFGYRPGNMLQDSVYHRMMKIIN